MGLSAPPLSLRHKKAVTTFLKVVTTILKAVTAFQKVVTAFFWSHLFCSAFTPFPQLRQVGFVSSVRSDLQSWAVERCLCEYEHLQCANTPWFSFPQMWMENIISPERCMEVTNKRTYKSSQLIFLSLLSWMSGCKGTNSLWITSVF